MKNHAQKKFKVNGKRIKSVAQDQSEKMKNNENFACLLRKKVTFIEGKFLFQYFNYYYIFNIANKPILAIYIDVTCFPSWNIKKM